MANLRIVYDNAVDRAVLTASSTAGMLAVDCLRSDTKASVWRSASPSATLTATWDRQEQTGCVALPFCNLTAGATLRVRAYAEPSDTVPLFDTGPVAACAYSSLGMWDWGVLPLGMNAYSHVLAEDNGLLAGVNAYAYGGGAYGCVWTPRLWARKVVIDIADPDNPAGYVEAARLVAGGYWSPAVNADYGASATPQDSSTQTRTDAGELRTERGPRSNRIALSMGSLEPADRAAFWRLMRSNGLSRPMFFSLFPESDDPELEQAHQVYGKLAAMAAVTIPQYSTYAAPCEIEEI